MSKETALAGKCPGCDQYIYYTEQHIPHCVGYPTYLAAMKKRISKTIDKALTSRNASR